MTINIIFIIGIAFIVLIGLYLMKSTNDFIEYKKEVEDFKVFIIKKYERIAKENGQSNESNTNGDRENQPGDIVTAAKSAKTGGKSKARTNKTKAQKYC